MKLRIRASLAVTAAASGLVLGGMAPATAAGTAGPTEHTDMGVTGDAVMDHLQNISDISVANKDSGFRALGTPGYEEAVEYVEQTLEATGAYDVTRQAFDIEDQTYGEVAVSVDGEDIAVNPASYTEGTEAPLTDVPLVRPPTTTTPTWPGASSAAATDYDDTAEGAVVLVARGSCTFGEKAQAATDAGHRRHHLQQHQGRTRRGAQRHPRRAHRERCTDRGHDLQPRQRTARGDPGRR